jgi:agmatinase
MILGGEHGILLPIVEAVSLHPTVRSLSELTIVQVDAHADLRDELNGEKLSHGTVMRRALDAGVGKIIQVGVRAFSKEEAEIIEREDRVETWFGRDLFSVSKSQANWKRLLERISRIEGPVWLTFDIDGLDGSLVPSTGTPVPGGLSHWGAVELIEALFEAPYVEVVGADVNEIVPDSEGSLTEFSAAMTAVKIVACHILARNLQKG